jgi:two-component system, NarL family, response regulator YdfI
MISRRRATRVTVEIFGYMGGRYQLHGRETAWASRSQPQLSKGFCGAPYYQGRDRMIRVLVLANSAVVRAGLQAMLREDGRFDPVAGDFPMTQLQRMALQKPGPVPDVVLAEIAGKRLFSLSPAPDGAESIPLVLLIDDVTRSELLRAIHIGARALLSRTAQPAEIFAAIEAAAAGLTAFGPDELDLLLPAANGVEPEHEVALEALSGREIEVLALMAQGLPNKSIANRLNISEHTVKFHVSSILSKLGASSRTDAVTRGLKAGLLVI